MKLTIPGVIHAIVSTFAVAMYLTFVFVFLLIVFLVLPARGEEPQQQQEQYTCEQVVWAVNNLPKDTLDRIKAQMTDEQIMKARKCLRRDARRKIANP